MIFLIISLTSAVDSNDDEDITLSRPKVASEHCPATWSETPEVCLLSSKLEGTIYLPGDNGFPSAARVLNTVFDNRPVMVVVPHSTGKSPAFNIWTTVFMD